MGALRLLPRYTVDEYLALERAAEDRHIYVLISQDEPQIEHHRRKSDGEWAHRLHSGLTASVVIGSIRCTLKLAEVYDRVVFVAD